MKCPFLKGRYMFSCSARREVYVPSIFELGEYCRTTRWRVCPLYCMAEDEWTPFLINEDVIPYDEFFPHRKELTK